ncbi:BCL2/adenovirus E1B 19 kDa protein-interacting protein 3-like [Tachypleus tridentatus]|uniref:BCL2/adenovirus E1B 19 kDa protein-interacting protein 3-like n=1 Tax=Tachypleus tridentatus TaxID=6853 RepID=UPI003FD658EB
MGDEIIIPIFNAESWVELNLASGECTHARSTPVPFGGSILNGNMENLLWEAQRESNRSSAVASGKSSHGNSPKSPHSPVSEQPSNPHELLIINREDLLGKGGQAVTDWIWEWSSRPPIKDLPKSGHSSTLKELA